MNEPAVLIAYVVSYGFMAAFLVRLILRDRKLRGRLGDK